ncbi:MAG: hypothetical protein H6550_14705 [Chitinophagales bacterium]|nr:hypothetical protein [Chitinophagales bacterium]
MKRPAIIIFIISVVLTALAFVHDYMYDTPSVPYTAGQYVVEILVSGTIYVGIFFALIYGLYALVRSAFR